MQATLKAGKRFVDSDGHLYEADKPETVTNEQATRLATVTALDKHGDEIPAFKISGNGAPAVEKKKSKSQRAGTKPAAIAQGRPGRGDLTRADLERV